ncbi:hypothetical protein ACLKA7_010795 [Drosophila subpalustris]
MVDVVHVVDVATVRLHVWMDGCLVVLFLASQAASERAQAGIAAVYLWHWDDTHRKRKTARERDGWMKLWHCSLHIVALALEEKNCGTRQTLNQPTIVVVVFLACRLPIGATLRIRNV